MILFFFIIIIIFYLRSKIRFCFFLSGESYGQLQICSHSIWDCSAIETLILLDFNDWLAYVSKAYLVF